MNDTSEERLHILMVTEGTYPFHWGGVSTWCHLLLRDLPHIDFTLMSLVGDPAAVPQFSMPASVVDFRPIPMWGIREVLETRKDLSLAELYARRTYTNEHTVERYFVPLFRSFLNELYADSGSPIFMGRLIHAMYRFFMSYDFDTAMRSQVVWETFQEITIERFPIVAAQYGYAGAHYSLADVTACFQWLYHWFFPLATPLPKADVIHAAMAGVCTLVAVAAKLEYGSAYMLTEHGIYLRERYLAEASTATSLYRKIFSLSFARRITELSYAMADQIAPCCDYNQRWELRNGAKPEQIKTIYYGVDSVTFAPTEKAASEPPVVVWVGRIDPLKDLLTLLRAAAIVHTARPDIEFRLFGSAPPGNEGYYEQCLQLRKELGLEEAVIFAGFRSNPAGAFNEGDIAVLSSVSEAFPFVILEAMLCEKPVVATAVGGIPEQVRGCGIAVEPRNPQAMAEAILQLMSDSELRATLGKAAREKALVEYSVRQSGMAHENVYRRLTKRKRASALEMPAKPVQFANGNGTADAVSSGGERVTKLELQQTSPVAHVSGSDGVSGNGNGSMNNYSNSHSVANSHHGGRSTPGNHADLSMPNQQAGHNSIPGAASTEPRVAVKHNKRYLVREPQPNLHHLPLTAASPHRQAEWRKRKAVAIESLADETLQRCYEPIDALEITALLESSGVTDDVAVQYYEAPDAFALGEAVLEKMKQKGLPKRPAFRLPPLYSSTKESMRDFLKGPLALLPPLVLLLIISTFGRLGNWNESQLLLLSLGITSSMLVSNGFVQAISRRTSLYLGMRKPEMAARFVLLCTAISAGGVLGIALVAFVFANLHSGPASQDSMIFLTSFVAVSLIWLTAGSLSLIKRSSWLGIALMVGWGVGVFVNAFSAPYTGAHLAMGAGSGFAASMGVILVSLYQGFRSQGGTFSKSHMSMPSVAYMVTEAAPYWVYGSIYMVFIMLPHVIGWFGTTAAGQSRASAFTTLEMGLTLSLLPLLLSYGVAERAMRLFWRHALIVQAETSGDRPARFGELLMRFVAHHRKSYILVLSTFTIIGYLGFDLLIYSPVAAPWLRLVNVDHFVFIYHAGLLVYALLGVGLFNSMFAVTLGQPQTAFLSLFAAIVAMVVVGIPLSQINYIYSAVGFVAAAMTFVGLSTWLTSRVLRTADFCFASVL